MIYSYKEPYSPSSFFQGQSEYLAHIGSTLASSLIRAYGSAGTAYYYKHRNDNGLTKYRR